MMFTRRLLGVLTASAVCIAAFCGDARSQAIQLARGHVLVGDVQDATGDGLTFRRLDNGGVLELQWSDLTPSSADQIRRLKGLLVEDEEEVMVDADVIVHEIAGGVRQELVGKIIEKTATHYTMRIKGNSLEIKRSSIKDHKQRRVPILEVYTRDDFYEEQSRTVNPGKDADKHIELADILRRAGDYARAEQHLQRADELGGGKQRNQLPAMLQRIQVLRESEAERALLARIGHMRNRKEFDKAAELIAEFEQKFADSALMVDLEREKRRYEADRVRTLIDSMRARWDAALLSVATAKVIDGKSTLAGVREYAESKMADDVFAHLGGQLGIEATEAKELWQQRFKFGKGRTIAFSYGVGSWVLGAEAVIKDTKAAKGEEEELDSEDPELRRLVRMIRENNNRARQIARDTDSKETDESFWKSLDSQRQRQWLRVYFAEFGGQMEVASAHATPCANCAGIGTTSALGSSGQPEKTECPVCHGTRYVRMLRGR